ncbi:hypothetical protein KJ885_01155 [Patescibacteria group bacterium]|nr:hypothetical protein [Patescibacteria group bacterium]
MLDLIKSITKKEWKFWIKVLIAVLILTSVARIFILIWMPEGYVPRGNNIHSMTDRYVYVSYVEQAREGAYLFEDLYTAKEESVPMLNIFWLGAGLFARFTGLSGNAALDILRILLIPFLLLAVYLLLVYFIKDIWQRKLSFLIASLGGGLGLVFLPILWLLEDFFPPQGTIRNLPIDIDAPGAFIFMTSYYSVHFIFSTFLFASIILLSLLAIQKKKLSYVIPAGLMSAILLNFHPWTFISIFFVFFIYLIFLLWKNREAAFFLLRYALILGLFILPSALYHLYMFYTPWWQNQTWNSTTSTPFIISILGGYGLILIFALYSLWQNYKQRLKIKDEAFLLIWLIGHFSLLFLPVSVQGRFLEGYWLVLVILGSYTLSGWLKKRQWIIKDKLYSVLLFIVCFGLSYVLVIFLDLRNVYFQGNLVYIKKDSVVAMKELKKIAGKDDLVLADIYNSSLIPGIALRRVFAGHAVETINFKEKYEILKRFMISTDPEEREAILQNNKIKYFFYDNSYKEYWAWKPDEEKYLKKVYELNDFRIYKVL